jgi:peptidoglycan/xylan/chitin deacetylase (PgdA/CDA1 family)
MTGAVTSARRPHVKAMLRRQIIKNLERAGAFRRAAASEWRRRRLLVLCYHGISLDNEHLWDPRMYFSPVVFRSRLALLRKWKCTVLPLEEGLAGLRAGNLPPRAVALTFDDGSCDFYLQTLPILQEFGYAATVYLTTYYSGRTDPVFPMGCSYVAWCGSKAVVDIRDLIRSQDGTFELSDPEQRGRLVRALANHADRANLSADAKTEFLERFAEIVRVDLSAIRHRRILQIMNAEEVAAASSAGMSVELHTHRHRTPEDRNLFLREIQDNRSAIEAMTGRTPLHFCYPSGVYRRMFVPWLREAGVVSATTCVPGLASPASDPMVLPRFVDRSPVSNEEFEAWITGVAAIFPSLRRLVAGRSAYGEA